LCKKGQSLLMDLDLVRVGLHLEAVTQLINMLTEKLTHASVFNLVARVELYQALDIAVFHEQAKEIGG